MTTKEAEDYLHSDTAKNLSRLIKSLSDYIIILSNQDDTYLLMAVFEPIVYNNNGDTLKPGSYFVWADGLCVCDINAQTVKKSNNIAEGLKLGAVPIYNGAEKLTLPHVVLSIIDHNRPSSETARALEALEEQYRLENKTTPASLAENKGITGATITDELFVRGALEDIKTYRLMNDKATTQLIASDIFTQEIDGQLSFFYRVLQSPKGDEPVTTTMSLTYEGTERLVNKKMSAFDNAVYNALSTIYYYWKQKNQDHPLYVTPQEVWRAMNGKRGNEKPTQKQLEKVIASLDKMRYTKFTLELGEEISAHYITLDDERITGGCIETYLIKADKVTFKTEKGRKIEGYKVTDEPILYTYNAAKGHVLRVEYELLDTSDIKNKGEYTIEFTTYLLQRIKNHVNGYLRSNRILLDTLYQATGIEAPSVRIKRANCNSDESYGASVRNAQKRDRDTIEAIFNSWIKKKLLIKSFKPVKKGNTVIGYDVVAIKDNIKALTED